jgi:hypothetical protein
LYSAIETSGADAGKDAVPVAQSWSRLWTWIESTPLLSPAVSSAISPS